MDEFDYKPSKDPDRWYRWMRRSSGLEKGENRSRKPRRTWRPQWVDRREAKGKRPNRTWRPAFLDRLDSKGRKPSPIQRPEFIDRLDRKGRKPSAIGRPEFLDKRDRQGRKPSPIQRPEFMDKLDREGRKPSAIQMPAWLEQPSSWSPRAKGLVAIGAAIVVISAALGIALLRSSGTSDSQPGSLTAFGALTATATTTNPNGGPGGVAVPNTPAANAGVDAGLAQTVTILATPAVAAASHPGGRVTYVGESAGRVWVMRTTNGLTTLSPTPALDVTGVVGANAVHGLLGLTVAPDGNTVYVSLLTSDHAFEVLAYPTDSAGQIRTAGGRLLLRLQRSGDAALGGTLTTDDKGLLYIGIGDGSDATTPSAGLARDLTRLEGKILRIDPTPSGSQPYTIPPDNPWASSPAGSRPEVWAFGVHDPDGLALDTKDRRMWLTDRGEEQFLRLDEVDAAPSLGRGADLGWDLAEGDARFRGVPPTTAVRPALTVPVAGLGCGSAGGALYTGASLPYVRGPYLYANSCSRDIIGISLDAQGAASDLQTVVSLSAARGAGVGTQPSGDPVVFGGDGSIYVVQAVQAVLDPVPLTPRPRSVVPPSQVTSACGYVEALAGLASVIGQPPAVVHRLVDDWEAAAQAYAPLLQTFLPQSTSLSAEVAGFVDLVKQSGYDGRQPAIAARFQQLTGRHEQEFARAIRSRNGFCASDQ